MDDRLAGPLTAALGKAAVLMLTAGLGFGVAMLAVFFPLVGVGGAAAIGLGTAVLMRPELLLVAFAFALGVPIQISASSVPLNAADALLVAWCACLPLILGRTGARGWKVPFLVKAVAPFAAAVALSQLAAADPPGSLKQLARIVEWFMLLPLAMTALQADSRFLRIAALVTMLVPCTFALDGIVEYFNHGNSISRIIGIPVPAPKDDSGSTLHHTFDVSGRAGSTFGGAQGLAMFLAMFMSVAWAHLFRAPGPALRWLAGISVAVCCAGLMVAESRGGALGALMSLAVIGVVLCPRLARRLAIVAGIVLLLGLAGLTLWPGWDGTIAGLIPGRAIAVLDRLVIWQMALRVWSDNPVLGVGLGNFRDHALANHIQLQEALGYESFHAHNTYLEVLADTGLLGFGCWVLFLGLVARQLLRAWRQVRGDANPQRGAFVLAALGALAAYAVFAAVDVMLLENMPFLLVMLLSLGFLAGAPTPRAAPRMGGAVPVRAPAQGLPA